jgi:hypothetical protein
MVFIERGSTLTRITGGDCFVFFVTYPLFQETVDALMKEREGEAQKEWPNIF